jgi:hypothetical protein
LNSKESYIKEWITDVALPNLQAHVRAGNWEALFIDDSTGCLAALGLSNSSDFVSSISNLDILQVDHLSCV